ncbi:MAG: hypothetical protein AB1668_03795 [Nanoarchaeota archaeon]
MKFNKRGGLYWVAVFLVLAAIFTFLLLSSTSKPEAGEEARVKGSWQISFLKDNYLAAEKKLLQNDIAAMAAGRETALELASNGGFLNSPDGNFPCGQVETINVKAINLWNDGSRFCFPDIEYNIVSSMEKKLKLKLPDQQFTEIGYSGATIFAQGKKENVTSTTGIYEYDTSFAVNIKYSFDEYEQLEKEAAELVSSCKNDADLNQCLDKNRPVHWKYGSCENEVLSQNAGGGRKVVFCVESPNKFAISTKENNVVKETPIRYKLALDFASEEANEQHIS